MAKGVDPGVEKKPLIRRIRRRRHKKSVVRKLVDYLRSDSYMFAPLLSSDFRASTSSPSGVELTMENRKEGKKSRVEKVGNYMNSDSYLYAPLFAPQRHYLSSKGNGVKRVSQKTVVEGKQEKLSEIRRRTSRISAVSVSVSGQVHKETIVKHMFNPSGKWLRKCLIE